MTPEKLTLTVRSGRRLASSAIDSMLNDFYHISSHSSHKMPHEAQKSCRNSVPPHKYEACVLAVENGFTVTPLTICLGHHRQGHTAHHVVRYRGAHVIKGTRVHVQFICGTCS